MRNILATLMVSQGTPMISHGDEIGRTQRGNNNVYCQDSEIAWMDWSLGETNADLMTFARTVTALRKNHPVFRRRRFFDGKLIRNGDEEIRDIAWLTTAGVPMTPEDWNSGFQSVAVFLNGDAIPAPDARGERVVDDTFLLCFNAHSDPVEFAAAEGDYAAEWTAEFDSAVPTGESDLVVKAGDAFTLQGRSIIVLRKTA
jgi:isoamylase